MLMIIAHFFAEQQSLKAISFIPLPNWHKLINVLLLIEQCSCVLYLGRVSGTISPEYEAGMFGVNLIMILVLQEKDQVHGEIKYSIIPLAINNLYMLFCNLQQLREFASYSSQPTAPTPGERSSKVNQVKVHYSIFWYFVSIAAYFMMESYHQGLKLESSKQMFQFSLCETTFMVSMAMSFFFSWQTYSLNEPLAYLGGDSLKVESKIQEFEVLPVSFAEVFKYSRNQLYFWWQYLCFSRACIRLQFILDPVFLALE
mmetsp:Transcript_8341/g.13953  ORF Transcript_8341/g.13953 Transcript_8341/m.13953 type:complete len:257 (+) Transcript_8341:321-1091(+)